MVNNDDTVIASQDDLKNHYMLIGPLTPIISFLNAQSLLGVASEKLGYYLIIGTINYVLTWLFIYIT